MKQVSRVIILIALAVCAATVARAASDDAESAVYVDGNYIGDNAGTGFGAWAQLESLGGGTFMEIAPAGTRVLGGTNSWAMFGGSGGFAVGRPLSLSLAQGSLSVDVRHSLADTGPAVIFSGFNIKSAAGSSFGTNELLSVGFVGGTSPAEVTITGASSQTLNLGQSMIGDYLRYSLSWDTGAGTYSLNVSNLTDNTAGSIGGSLKATGSPVAVVGFGQFSTGNFQDLIFDNLNVIPEPSTITLVGLGLLGALALNRRRGETNK